MTSAVLIIPADDLDAANAFGVEQGWGEGNFSVPLSPTGAEPTTHWGCRAEVGPIFIEMVENPSPENEPLVAALIYSFSDSLAPYDHWVEVLAEQSLTIIVPPDQSLS
jgi:hypothetical protein